MSKDQLPPAKAFWSMTLYCLASHETGITLGLR
jgi:hypothetical protein